MPELFNAHFHVGQKEYIYRLNPDQSVDMYRRLGQYMAAGEGAEDFDLQFTDEDHDGLKTIHVFKLDTEDTLTLYRHLGVYLQKRYRGNAPLSVLREVTS